MSQYEVRSGGSSSLARNTAFEALSSARRRRLLTHLAEDGEMAVSDLVRTLAEEEADGEPHRVDREAVGASVRHVHLPALENAGLVEWGREAGTVSLAPGARELPLFTPPPEPSVARRGAVTPEVCFDVE